MAIVLFDSSTRKNLLPLTATKAIADIRWGILKIKEWWQCYFTNDDIYIYTEDYLKILYKQIPNEEHIWIDATTLPNKFLVEKIKLLNSSEALVDDNGLIAGKIKTNNLNFTASQYNQHFQQIIQIENIKRLKENFELFLWNDDVLKDQFNLITKNRISQPISNTNKISGGENIFLEEGASVEHCILNAANGFIYIGKNALVMEGCIIRGSLSLCENAVLKSGAKIFGATTIGKKSVGGGEIKNSIISDNSNKAHDGYLGDSVIGEWCNLGAGTTNSNVKNSADVVKLWSYAKNDYISAGKKCGVFLGDYSRTAINSSINTGSNFGVCCNIFGVGLLPTVLHHFNWGTQQMSKYKFDKAIKDIDNWKSFKNEQITEEEISVLKFIFTNN